MPNGDSQSYSPLNCTRHKLDAISSSSKYAQGMYILHCPELLFSSLVVTLNTNAQRSGWIRLSRALMAGWQPKEPGGAYYRPIKGQVKEAGEQRSKRKARQDNKRAVSECLRVGAKFHTLPGMKRAITSRTSQISHHFLIPNLDSLFTPCQYWKKGMERAG